MLTRIPTALSPAEVHLLQRLAEGKRVVEAGALLGYSTIALAQIAAHVVSIDKHKGYSGPTWRRFRSNLERAGLAAKVTPLREDALVELPRRPADLAFIDLTCEFDLTLRAVQASRAPLVALHDYGRQNCADDMRRVLAALQRPVVERADTLIVLKNPGVPIAQKP